MYPPDVNDLLLAFFDVDLGREPWKTYAERGEGFITEWTHPTAPQPSDTELTDFKNGSITSPTGKTFAAWLAEHGGDANATRRRQARRFLAEPDPVPTALRAELAERNRRDNYLVNRIIELQNALAAIKASTGPADNIRAAIPPSFAPTAARPLPEARSDLDARINDAESDP